MKSLLDILLGTRTAKPVFAEDEGAERAMRIAELKWLLREIAAPPAAKNAGNDNRNERAGREVCCA